MASQSPAQSLSLPPPGVFRSYVIIAVLIGSVLAFLYALFIAVPAFVRSQQIPIERALGFTPPPDVKVIGAYELSGGFVAELSTRDPAQKVTILRVPSDQKAPLAAIDVIDALRMKKNLPTSKPDARPVPVSNLFVEYLSAHVDLRRVTVLSEEIQVSVGGKLTEAISFRERDKLHFILAAGNFQGHEVVVLMARKEIGVDVSPEGIGKILDSLGA